MVWKGFPVTRYDEDLREPLVQCQISQVSMRVARGSVKEKSNLTNEIAPMALKEP